MATETGPKRPSRRAKPAAKPAAAALDAPPEPKAEAPKLTLGGMAGLSGDMRTLAVNVTILLIIIIVVPVVLSQFLRDQVLIDPIAVPAAMQSTGLTPEIAANRLWDGLKEVEQIADTSKDTVDAIPDSEQVDFSIPDSGLSIDSLIYYVRRFFNIYETHIGGEFRCGDAECTPEGITLRIRVTRNELDVMQLPAIGGRSEAEYFRAAATEVMAVLDPFTAISARSHSEPGRAKALAFQLIASGHKDAKWAHNLIGNLLVEEDKLPAAMAAYRAALAIDPNFHLARTNLGNLLRISGDAEGARAEYNAVYKADPRNVFAVQGLADLAIAEGRADDAVRLLLEAAKADPLQPSYFTKAANVELNRNNAEQAIAYWRKALEIEPSNVLALAQLALHFYNTEQYGAAEELYGAAADYDPTNSAALADHADLLILTKKFDRALERADQALALAPDSAYYMVLRATALTNLDRPADAIETLLAAQTIEPSNPEIAYRMAPAYDQLGKYAEAIAAYRRFIALDPESPMTAVAEAFIDIFEAKLAAPPDTPL